jgi:hypothetical protein
MVNDAMFQMVQEMQRVPVDHDIDISNGTCMVWFDEAWFSSLIWVVDNWRRAGSWSCVSINGSKH